ncbi:Ketoacyl-synthetase C-terminal extension [Micromonospora pattaloongensis]|uniref:Ketoacyl-synthetase C-terminal extension n=1 Tax=Micromonospora pattaloongensis TaxID=405436 RepID=A0A1H3PAU8_9ACTN|nr:polyketide synthase [Micromonospora pattaloongensis]SDY98262.1 Ketoacyl-synthetase C-terminal extension [Micromonospora pattaloongensis]
MRDYIDSLGELSKHQLILALARQRLAETEPAAVVGMACRFPGGISDPAAFWATLVSGRVVLDESRGIPRMSTGAPRWNVAAPDLAPYADLLARGSYLTDVDLFDPEPFGIGEDEALYMDPQQRLLLTTAAAALADAGLDAPTERSVGVFVGVSTVEYNLAGLRNGADPSPWMGTGGALSATAARVASALRLNGPALTVDTACSSALTALHLAVGALRRRECDVAVVGACHLLLSPYTSVVFDRAGMLSPTGRSLPFDGRADGHVRGEGCGVLVLRREREARADGVRPYASVCGGSVHQHGDRPGLAAVSAAGQRRTIRQALHAADLPPHDVHYVEAQANGSRIGAVVELETLAAAYDRGPDAPPLYVGSAKANLGYLETASGAAALIKTVLALHHGVIPPQPGPPALDPAVPWDRIGIEVPTRPLSWPTAERRRAGVSAFGFTGTNAHVLLEATDEPAVPAASPADVAPVTGRSYWPAVNAWS